MFGGKDQRKAFRGLSSPSPFPFRFLICLRAFALAAISRRGSRFSSMLRAAGVNQRGSHICTSCGAIAHARVTESRGLGLETLGDHRAGQDAGLTRVASRGGTRRGHQLARLGRTISIPRVPSPSLRSLLAPPPHCGGGAGAQPRPRGLPPGTLPLDE